MDTSELKISVEMAERAEHDLFIAANQYRVSPEDYVLRFTFLERLQHYVVVQKLLAQAQFDIIDQLANPPKKFYQFWK